MKNELVVNIGPFENRLALLENNKLVELFIHREDQKEIVGNIYKGIVKDNVPGMGASFIDIGLERTALLHFRDAVPDFMDLEELDDENLKEIKNDIYKMGELLESGQEVMVEVERAPLGKKGARLTGEISIPGRFMVFMPNKNYIAISRKITSTKEKRRLKQIFSKIKDKNVGLIIRTFAEYHDESELKKEYKNLMKTWEEIQDKFKNSPAPACIYDDNDLSSIIIRDLIHKSIDVVTIDSKKVRTKIIKQLKKIAPDFIKKIKLYREDANIFDAYGIEKEISKIFRSRIYLDSGGFIVIQQTEALVSIDVNTGSFVGDKNLENTVTITNIDAAKEIARQIRLQDLTGMIFIDFIDMNKPGNRMKVIQTFRDEMSKDFSPHKIFSSSPLNMVEMTRKRAKANLLSNFYEACPCCQSVGRVLSRTSILDNIFRWMDRAAKYHSKDELEIHIHPWVYDYIIEKKPTISKEYPFEWKFALDGELGITDYKIISSKTTCDITDLYEV
ncbi:MAG TPA: Rne/Rng family ribonuclease [Candidatus Cloacimonetes bacterium]|nr:Rne/Rng family ribonuclease [Candidatus Cloacimonadota bacterium]